MSCCHHLTSFLSHPSATALSKRSTMVQMFSFGCGAVPADWCCDTSVLNPISTDLFNLIVALEGVPPLK